MKFNIFLINVIKSLFLAHFEVFIYCFVRYNPEDSVDLQFK